MINIFVGKPGTGKTYSLVRLAYKLIQSGRDIYSNFPIFFDKLKLSPKAGKIYFWKTVDDLMLLKNGEILMDEAQIWLNSRKWQDLPPELMYKLQQHRKQGINIWGAVQNVNRIDKVARELVNSVFKVKKIGKLFLVNEYDIEEIDKVKKQSYSFKFYFFSKKIANSYDTLAEIDYMNQKVKQNLSTAGSQNFLSRGLPHEIRNFVSSRKGVIK